MGYEARKTGAHALTCDEQGCPSELIAPTQGDLVQDAIDAGWDMGPSLGRCTCASCLRGVNIGEAQLQKMFGGALEVQVLAHADVHSGDPCVQEVHGSRMVIGTYMQQATLGTPVRVRIGLPKPKAKERISKQLAEVLQVPYVVYQQPDAIDVTCKVVDEFPPLALPAVASQPKTDRPKIVLPALPTDLFGSKLDDKGNN